MQHHRPVLLAVLGDVARLEPLGQDEVDLMGAALPLAADRIAQDELRAWAVERALAGVELGLEAGRLESPPAAPSARSQIASAPVRTAAGRRA